MESEVVADSNSESKSNSKKKEELNVSYSQLHEEEQEQPSSYLYYSMAHFECDFARTCNDGEGIFLPMVFCRPVEAECEGKSEPQADVGGSSFFPSKQFLLWLTSVPLILLLLVLFRVLGSTGEEFFSPSLELYRYENTGGIPFSKSCPRRMQLT